MPRKLGREGGIPLRTNLSRAEKLQLSKEKKERRESKRAPSKSFVPLILPKEKEYFEKKIEKGRQRGEFPAFEKDYFSYGPLANPNYREELRLWRLEKPNERLFNSSKYSIGPREDYKKNLQITRKAHDLASYAEQDIIRNSILPATKDWAERRKEIKELENRDDIEEPEAGEYMIKGYNKMAELIANHADSYKDKKGQTMWSERFPAPMFLPQGYLESQKHKKKIQKIRDSFQVGETFPGQLKRLAKAKDKDFRVDITKHWV